MMNGNVLYRDVYDHKGPLLYFLHGLAYMISNRTFLGIYIFEIVSWTVYLAGVCHIVALLSGKISVWCIPVYCALLVSSPSFCHGDSAEEFCIPLLIWGFYALLKYMQEEYPKPIKRSRVFLHGIIAGCILCTKFTLLGMYFAWTVVLIMVCFTQKKWKAGVGIGLSMLAGMAVATIPWFMYFGWNHALKDWWIGYIHNNLFLYSGAGTNSIFRIVKDIAKMTLDTFVDNFQYGFLTIAGVLWYGTIDKRQQVACKIGIWFLCIMTMVGIGVGVKQWQPYYGLILAIYSSLGISALMEWIVRHKKSSIFEKRIMLLASAIVGVCLITFCGNYSESLLGSKSSLVQYRFAEKMSINEETDILNYGFLDGGFYTVTGIVPECKYFAKLNLGLDEMMQLQESFVAEGKVDYVITREFKLDETYQDMYRLIDSAEQDYEGIVYQYYLYQKK